MSIIITDVSGVTKRVEAIDVSDDNATPSKAQTEAAADDIIKEAGKRDTKEDENAPVEAIEVKQPEPPADDGDKASPDEVADAIVDAATGDEIVEDSRSNIIIGNAKNKAAFIEEQMDKAEDKTDIKIMDTNVQSSSALEAAGEVNSDVKRKVFERLGD
ncbi:g3454 [Coccomyxa elongata]